MKEEYIAYTVLIIFVFGIVMGLSHISKFTDVNDKKMLYQHYMLPVVGLLFFALTPGILVTLPPNGSKIVVAVIHAAVFALAFHLTHKVVWNYFYGREKFGSKPTREQVEKKQKEESLRRTKSFDKYDYMLF